MAPTSRPPRILFIDSGLGGLTVLDKARHSLPGAHFIYIADDAAFPYGAKGEDELRGHLAALLERALNTHTPDCVVLACNTASTLALGILRKTFGVPFIGTVPAIKPAAAMTRSGFVSVLATPATISRDYTKGLIEEFGCGVDFNLVGTHGLAALAEAHAQGIRFDESAVAAEIAPCFIEWDGRRTDVVVLGCTHYPLLLPVFEKVAPWPVTWIDPAEGVARRLAVVVAGLGFDAASKRDMKGEFLATSGAVPSSGLQTLLSGHSLQPYRS